MTATDDPGGDANDLFGMSINYYKNDYKRSTAFDNVAGGEDQFNGNIKGIAWNTDYSLSNSPSQYTYSYDKNNWLNAAAFNYENTAQEGIKKDLTVNKVLSPNTTLAASNSITFLPGTHIVATGGSVFVAKIATTTTSDFGVSNITYDANGNIQTLRRNKNTENGSNRMDDLTYVYDTRKPNQLKQVVDAVTATTNADDIKTQPKYNYSYNSIGQLYYNRQEGLWYAYNAAGLVTEVKKNNVPLVRFYYNDRGHRVKKISYVNGTVQTTTHYVRDVAGMPLAIYENNTLTEHPIYGASRLGVYNRKSKTTHYQLTDHLGNVRAVIAKQGNNAAALVAKTDYYPFGMPMPNRNVEGDYRYKFQGQEKDKETGMEAFELRLWDSRIGRWLSPDPYGIHRSPYLGMANNPIGVIDRDGGIPIPIITGAIGAIINAGINAYSQYQDGTLDFSSGNTWARLGVAAGGGFVAGATGNLAVAVATNTVGDVADQLISNGGDVSNINYTQTAFAGVGTFVGGKLGGKAANNWFVKTQARALHTKLYSRKFSSLGKTLSGTSKSIREINDIAFKNTSEVFGGLVAGGITTQITSGLDARNFKAPDFSGFQNNFSFHNQFNNFNWFNSNSFDDPNVIHLPEIVLTPGDPSNPSRVKKTI